MIAWTDASVEKDAKQLRPPRDAEPCLLSKLISQSYFCGLADLNAITREVPAGRVSVPNEQKVAFGLFNNGPDTQCQTSLGS
jgi:hypothetical protein